MAFFAFSTAASGSSYVDVQAAREEDALVELLHLCFKGVGADGGVAGAEE